MISEILDVIARNLAPFLLMGAVIVGVLIWRWHR